MGKYFADMDIGMEWILKDPDYFTKKDVSEKPVGHWYVSKEDLSEEFLNWLDKNNLDLYYSELFYCSPGERIPMHVDEIKPANVCKLNWVYDEGETWMNWYELKPGKEIVKRDNSIGGLYWDCPRDDCEFAEKSKIQKPTLVNAGVLHDVENNSQGNRWCLSLVPQFKNEYGPMTGPRFDWEQGLEVFKDYLK